MVGGQQPGLLQAEAWVAQQLRGHRRQRVEAKRGQHRLLGGQRKRRATLGRQAVQLAFEELTQAQDLDVRSAISVHGSQDSTPC